MRSKIEVLWREGRTIEKTKVLWINNAKEANKQKAVVARYFLGIEIGHDEVGNRTGEMLRLGQMVFSDGYDVVGIVK